MSDLNPPTFDARFRDQLVELMTWRRDVRRFRTDPVSDEQVETLLRLAMISPSVGNSQPWRFISVESRPLREIVRASFERCNADALNSYSDEQAEAYARLKLAGLNDAPVHLAVFCDLSPAAGHGLGRATMPEMLNYSVVTAISTLWLAARSYGLGIGWVSILDPVEITKALDVPPNWTLIAYLCVGYPVEEHSDPELVRHGWQDRIDLSACYFKR